MSDIFYKSCYIINVKRYANKELSMTKNRKLFFVSKDLGDVFALVGVITGIIALCKVNQQVLFPVSFACFIASVASLLYGDLVRYHMNCIGERNISVTYSCPYSHDDYHDDEDYNEDNDGDRDEDACQPSDEDRAPSHEDDTPSDIDLSRPKTISEAVQRAFTTMRKGSTFTGKSLTNTVSTNFPSVEQKTVVTTLGKLYKDKYEYDSSSKEYTKL